MNTNLTILGALFILVLFGVGESIYKKFGLNRVFLLIMLGLLMVGLYAPNLHIKDVSLSISGLILPSLFCLLFCFKIRSKSFFINALICMFFALVLRLVYIDLDFVPFYVQASAMAVLGLILALNAKEPFSLFCAIILGFVGGNAVYELAKYSSIKTAFESSFVLSFVLLALIVGIICLYAKTLISSQTAKKQQKLLQE